jgi:predicted transcriptional regulator
MGLFEKADADVQAQKAAESALRSKRRDRDSLNERLGISEAAIASYRQQARQLAANCADDKAISAAEGKMRDAQDRSVTLSGAIVDVDKTIAELVAQIDQIVDKRCRAETSAAVNAMASELEDAARKFASAAQRLGDAARATGLLVPEGTALHQWYALHVREQLAPTVETIISALRAHGQGVLNGSRPAGLPRPAPEPPKLVVVPPPETQNVFILRNLKFVNQAGGIATAGRYKRADLPKKLAELALASGAALSISDKRCRDLEQMASPLQPHETSCEWIGPKGRESAPLVMRRGGGPPIHSSLTEFTPMDRGKPFTVTVPRGPEPEPMQLAAGARKLDGETP